VEAQTRLPVTKANSEKELRGKCKWVSNEEQNVEIESLKWREGEIVSDG